MVKMSQKDKRTQMVPAPPRAAAKKADVTDNQGILETPGHQVSLGLERVTFVFKA